MDTTYAISSKITSGIVQMTGISNPILTLLAYHVNHTFQFTKNAALNFNCNNVHIFSKYYCTLSHLSSFHKKKSLNGPTVVTSPQTLHSQGLIAKSIFSVLQQCWKYDCTLSHLSYHCYPIIYIKKYLNVPRVVTSPHTLHSQGLIVKSYFFISRAFGAPMKTQSQSNYFAGVYLLEKLTGICAPPPKKKNTVAKRYIFY